MSNEPVVTEVSIEQTNRVGWLGVQGGTLKDAIDAFVRKHGYTPATWARNPLDGLILVGPVQEVER